MATIMTLRGTTTHARPIRIAIYGLVSATALVHLALGAMTSVMLATQPALVASMGGATALTVMAALFYCNFAGYVVLTAALYHPAARRFQRVTRWALIGYATVTVLAYFALAQGHVDAFGLSDKVCEVALIALLVIEGRRAR
jgi:UDP-N-acetylglucosamine:LPS N-acetylglucosamine transferase